MIRTGLIVSAICLALMAGIALWAGGQLPADNIPVHWDASGVPDRFSDRSEALFVLWLLPGCALFGVLVFCLLPQIEPLQDNLFKSRKAYNAVWIATMILFLGIHGGITYMMVQSAGDQMQSNEFVRIVIAGTGILFVVMGNYLPKTRQNWFLGIRTPWTLSSEYTWEKTHRLGGRLFFAVGFFCLIGAFIVDGIALVAMVTGSAVGVALICAIYSFIVYRSAPDKRVSPDYIV
ncbi:MAG: SdpI family protein [Pseudomonadota bacterium]